MRTTNSPRPAQSGEPQEPRTAEYHPFAHLIDDREWIVEDPRTHRPLGFVRCRVREGGVAEYVVYPWHDESIVVRAFDGVHETLFEAVAWLRWRDTNGA